MTTSSAPTPAEPGAAALTSEPAPQDPTPQWWADQAAAARDAMLNAPTTGKVLIEVAAQRPLHDGRTPGAEFQARLDRGAELAHTLVQDGWHVEMYVPGSRHRVATTNDEVSLSSAGTTYLRSRVAPEVALRGDDLNEQYLPTSGVFGSADECFVTSERFRDGQFERLLAVVSPQQLTRKLVHYLAFGVEPQLHTAPVLEPFHGIVYELTVAVPEALARDPRAQGPNSATARRLREDRRPAA